MHSLTAIPLRFQRAQTAAVRRAEGQGVETHSDDELLRRARRGRREAFDQLVRRHQGASLQLAWKYLGDAALAKDACQAAFLEVFRGLPTYQPRDRFVFWLRRILINQCRMAARSTRLRERATRSLGRQPYPAVERPDEWLALQERRKAVEGALQRLSEKLKEVAVLRYVSGHTLEEIAAILELPLGTVKSRLSAAVAGLRAGLEGAP
ncbi:MAG: sigW 1 [Myxococcaceae bacterium]|nr:sigW 1 [Myxococcaceae bacterium]